MGSFMPIPGPDLQPKILPNLRPINHIITTGLPLWPLP